MAAVAAGVAGSYSLGNTPFLTLAHSAEVGQVYAALRAKVATTRDLHFADWHGEMQLVRAYDRIPVRVGQPDGTFHLITPHSSVCCFVEVDRGRPVKTWREKILALPCLHQLRRLAAMLWDDVVHAAHDHHR